MGNFRVQDIYKLHECLLKKLTCIFDFLKKWNLDMKVSYNKAFGDTITFKRWKMLIGSTPCFFKHIFN